MGEVFQMVVLLKLMGPQIVEGSETMGAFQTLFAQLMRGAVQSSRVM